MSVPPHNNLIHLMIINCSSYIFLRRLNAPFASNFPLESAFILRWFQTYTPFVCSTYTFVPKWKWGRPKVLATPHPTTISIDGRGDDNHNIGSASSITHQRHLINFWSQVGICCGVFSGTNKNKSRLQCRCFNTKSQRCMVMASWFWLYVAICFEIFWRFFLILSQQNPKYPRG